MKFKKYKEITNYIEYILCKSLENKDEFFNFFDVSTYKTAVCRIDLIRDIIL